MPSIAETVTEMMKWVFPEHAGAPGQIHGGRMMQWIATVGTIAASRVARGPVVLGAMDNIDFLYPVRVGEIAVLRAQVEAVGRCSLEVGVRVYAEKPNIGERALTVSTHLVFVKVDEAVRSIPVGRSIEPRGPDEEALFAAAQERRRRRLQRFARRADTAGAALGNDSEDFRWQLESIRAISPEDLPFGNTMFAGNLLMDIDEAARILSMRYNRGLTMTACLDAMDFYHTISTHEVVTFKAGLNHVGTTSLEIGVKVLSEAPWTGEVQHACTAYLTFVHLGSDLRPRPCPPFTPETPGEQRRWAEALERRTRRLERLKLLNGSIHKGR